MFCASCGAPLEPGATFCHRCGAMLPAPVPAAEGAPLAAPAAAAPAPVPPLDVSSALSDGMRRAFAHFGAFLATQGLFLLLAGAITTGASVLLLETATAELAAAAQAGDMDALLALAPPFLAIAGTTTVVTLLLRGIGLALGITVAEALERGERIGIGEAWTRAAPRIGNLLLTLALVGLAVVACFLLGVPLAFLVIPLLAGIVLAAYLLVLWSLAAPVSMLETRRPTDNLRRAAELSRGHRGALFLAFGAIVIASSLPATLVGFAMAPETAFSDDAVPSPAQTLVTGIVSTVMSILAGIVTSCFLVRLYRQRVPPSP